MAPAKGDRDTRPGVKIRRRAPLFARVPTIDRRVPHLFKAWHPETSTNRSKQKTSDGKIIVLSLSIILPPHRSPMEEYDSSHKSNENYALVAIVGIYGGRFPPSASKTQS